MKQHKYPLRKLLRIVLSCLCIILIIILWLELKPSKLMEEQPEKIDVDYHSNHRKIDKQEFIFPEITTFDEIIQRPLFDETRLPFLATEPVETVPKSRRRAKQTSQSQKKISLSAVVITPEKQIAILESGRGKDLQRLALGEMIDGWTLKNVATHSIRLTKGAETKDIELEVKGSKNKPEIKSKSRNRVSTRADNAVKQKIEMVRKDGKDDADKQTDAKAGKE